jgi:hypothetical protein
MDSLTTNFCETDAIIWIGTGLDARFTAIGTRCHPDLQDLPLPIRSYRRDPHLAARAVLLLPAEGGRAH